MPGKSDFEARLNRLGHRPAVPSATPQPQPVPVKTAHTGLIYAILAIVGGFVLLAVGMVWLASMPKNRPMAEVTSAFLAEEAPPQGPSAFLPVNVALRDNDYLQSCLPFFPPAPEGWVRVTTWDATYPGARARLAELWQAEGKAIETATGHDDLDRFLTRYSGPLAKEKNLKIEDTISSAIYLDVVNDGFLQVTLMSRPWNATSTCRDEFLYQWDRQDTANPPRFPVLNQFSYATMGKSRDWLTPEQRAQDYAVLRYSKKVSAGLTLHVHGIHGDQTPFEVLNSDTIAARVAMARAES